MEIERVGDEHEFSQERLSKLPKQEQIEMVKRYLKPDIYTLDKERLGDLDDDVRYLILDKYAKERPRYVVNNIDIFNIKDDIKRYEVAKQIMEDDIGLISYIDKFNISKEEVRIQLFRELLDDNDPVKVMNEIKKFHIENQEVLVDIAKGFLNDRLLGEILIGYFNDMGIQDEKQRLYFLKELAKTNGDMIPTDIANFNITDQEELFNIAKKLITQYGFNVAYNIDKFRIMDYNKRLELANMLVRKNGYELIQNLEKFKIDNPDDLFDLACKIVKNNASVVAENVGIFNLKDEDKRIKLATLIAKNKDGNISRHIKSFNISDEKERIKIAKIAIHNQASSVAQFIKEYNIIDKQVLLDIALNIARLDDTVIIMNNLGDYGIGDLKDLKHIFDIMISQDNENTYKLKTLDNYRKELQKIYTNMSILRILPVPILKMLRFLSPKNIDKIILCKDTIKNVQLISEFYHDKIMNGVEINVDMEEMLGHDNAQNIRNTIVGMGNPRDVEMAKEIVEKILFAQINVSKEVAYKDQLTKLILELITIRKTELKQQLLPDVVKYIYDDKLKNLGEEMKQTEKKKAYPAINAVLFDMLSLNDDAMLLNKVRTVFYNTNFIKDSKSLQDVYLTILRLQRTYLEKREISNIMEYLVENPKKLKDELKYMSSIMSFDRVDDVRNIQKTSEQGELRRILYSIYQEYLNVNGNEKFIEEYERFVNKPENKKRNLEELIMKYVLDNNKYSDVMSVVKQFMETMSDIQKFRDVRYDKAKSEHLSQINEIDSKIYEKWTKGQKEFEQICIDGSSKITDDPVDLFLIGTEVDGSCQSIVHGGDLNKCLMGYVIDGKNKAVVIKNEHGKIIARSVIRLLIDKKSNNVVCLRERPYKSLSVNEGISKQLDARCIEYAKWLGVSLVCEKTGQNQMDKIATQELNREIFEGTLVSKKGIAPYEYVDSAYKYYDGSSYEIHNELVYMLKKE